MLSYRLYLALAVVTAYLAVGGIRSTEAGPGSNERKTQRDTCGGMVRPTNPPPPPPTDEAEEPTEEPTDEPSPSPDADFECPLVTSLQNICNDSNNDLTDSERETFQQWIISIQIEIAECNANASLSSDQIVVLISYKIKAFLKLHVSISEKICYLNLVDGNGVQWGYVEDFINIAVLIQSDYIEASVTLDTDNDCPFLKAIKQAGESSGNSGTQSRCNALVERCRGVLESSLEITYKLSFIVQIIEEEYSDLMSLLLTIDISGFGSCVSFLDVCKQEQKIVKMNSYMGGSSSSDCAFLADLSDLWHSCSSNGVTFDNVTTCVSIKQMYDRCTVVFSASVDIEVRMENISIIIYQFCKGAPWLCGELLGRCGCSINDIQFISNYCHYHDSCGCANGPPPSIPSCPGDCGSGSGSGETGTPGCPGSEECGSGETGSPAPGSGETGTPGCPGSEECGSGETGSPAPGSGETGTPGCPGSEECGSGETGSPAPGSGETGTPGCPGSEECGSGETGSPAPGSGETGTPGCPGSEECGSGETGSPAPGSGETGTPGCPGSEECGSGETGSPAPGSEETETPSEGPVSTPAVTTPAVTTPAVTTPAVTTPDVTTPAVTTPAVTTPAVTTPAVTTPAASTPAPTTSVCQAREDCVTVRPACNCSNIIISINVTYMSWSGGQRLNFAPTFACIKNAVYDRSLTPSQVINKIINCLTSWVPGNASYRTQMYATLIVGTSMTVGDFVGCGNAS